MAKPCTNAKPISINALLGAAVVQQEMLLFVLVSALDVFMTYILLRQNGGQFFESNPVARFFIQEWGIKGMVYFKFGTVGFVCLLSQIIAQRKPAVARWLLLGATGLVSLVVVYSLLLFLQHGDLAQEELTAILNFTWVRFAA